jgi:ubiquitin-protein ligase E3 A
MDPHKLHEISPPAPSAKRPATSKPAMATEPLRKSSKENPALSLKDVRAALAQTHADGEAKALIRMAGAFFSNEQKLNSSFISADMANTTDPASEIDPAVDHAGLDELYRIVTTHSPGVKNAMVGALRNMLDALRKQVTYNPGMFSKPKSLRFVPMILANPLLLDPEFTHLTKRLCYVVSGLRPEAKATLVSWFEHQGAERLIDAVKKLQQYITLSIYQGENIADGVTFVTLMLGLAHEANVRVGQKTGTPLVSNAMFQNDAINSEIHLARDFEKWYADRKEKGGGSGGAGGWRRQRQQLAQTQKALQSRPSAVSSSTSSSSSSPVSYSSAAAGSSSLAELNAAIPEREAWQAATNLKLNDFSFCVCNFVLDTGSKAEMLRYDAILEQRSTVMDSVRQNMGFVNRDDVYLMLDVDRNNIIQSTMQGVAGVRKGDLKKPLKVKFRGERGVDEGGVRKEFFQVILRELFDPKYAMFTYNEDSRLFFFSPDSFTAPIEFELIGTLLGLAIFNSVILDVHFPRIVYHMLVGKCITLEHLKDLRPTVYKSFLQLLSCDDASVVDLHFEFSRTTVFGEQVTEELKEGGSNIPVTNDNREEFVDLYLQRFLYTSVKTSFDAFRRGFSKVCDTEVLDWFHPDEIELLVCGSPSLDFADLREGARYDGFEDDQQIIEDFWSVVFELSPEQQKQLLCFATGSARAPIRGLSDLRMTVTRAGPDSDQLPTSHTCFNTLVIPEYS